MRVIRLAALLLSLSMLAAACGLASAQDSTSITAILPSTNNLFVGSEVRVLGLQVGNVTSIEPMGEVVRVELRVDGQELPADVRADLKPTSLLGERFVQLSPPYTGGPTFDDGGEIPLERTSAPVDVDDVLRSFDNFLRSLDRDALAGLIDSLADTFAGQGEGLNELIDEGSESFRVLADSSEDLNALVNEFAVLNETLATREQTIGRTLDRLSIILQTLIEERDNIIASIASLRRLVIELRPLLDEHTAPLIADLEVLATTLSTVERNLERVGDVVLGARMLFEGAGRAVEWEDARIKLNNQTGRLGEAIAIRTTDRLVGLCMRLEVPECSTPDFFEPIIGTLLCQTGPGCEANQASLAQYLAEALNTMPPEVMETLKEEAAERAEEEARDEPVPQDEPDEAAPPQEPPSLEEEPDRPLLPLPDPRLQGDSDPASDGLLSRLIRGGGS